ncbi:hypothetical protein FNT36_09350 [Hymenobacter setariae]|uniref:Lipoprotein n=1 Tax=Hymenobacter setariae TaxID=2594794 RepID=A0A558BYN1_9BACT|nr:hypothetical protein [Hymenobacter setariae]TVT41628.1 hypothetical protein FNT36_09350 [Hymenobacter setariae]
MRRAFLGLLACGLLACSKTTLQMGQLVTLVPKQPTTLALGGIGTAEATLIDLNDSRCPSDVTCVWAGTLAATVTVVGDGPAQTVRLGYQKSYVLDSAIVTLHAQSYWVRLLDATPYPSTKNAGLLRTVTLRLRPA